MIEFDHVLASQTKLDEWNHQLDRLPAGAVRNTVTEILHYTMSLENELRRAATDEQIGDAGVLREQKKSLEGRMSDEYRLTCLKEKPFRIYPIDPSQPFAFNQVAVSEPLEGRFASSAAAMIGLGFQRLLNGEFPLTWWLGDYEMWVGYEEEQPHYTVLNSSLWKA